MSNEQDPFSPESDPYATRVSRRTAALVLASVPLAACAPSRPACAPVPRQGSCCPARFCRYFATRACSGVPPAGPGP